MGEEVGIIVWVDTMPMSTFSLRPKSAWSFGNCSFMMLAEGIQPARLETRTKESNKYASWWVKNPLAQET